MIKPRKLLVKESKYKIKCPHQMEPKSITVHNTYNDASAENEVKYMITNNKQVSFHFAVDDEEVIQGIPIDRNAWAAGDGNGPGNRSSIHIEICYSKSGGERYQKAEANAIKFIAKLLKERGWGIDRVKKHQDWSGKYCPHRILSERRWDSFLNAVDKEIKKLVEQKEEKPKKQPKKETLSKKAIVPYPGHLFKTGSRGKDVERIQRAVGAKADGIFGPKTEAAVKAYQKRHGLAVDGIVGPKTWNVMF